MSSRYEELFGPVKQATAMAAMLTGVSERSLHRLRIQSLSDMAQPREAASWQNLLLHISKKQSAPFFPYIESIHHENMSV